MVLQMIREREGEGGWRGDGGEDASRISGMMKRDQRSVKKKKEMRRRDQ